MPASRYVLVVDNLSHSTPSRDLEKEFAACVKPGRVRYVQKNDKRCALVEFERSDDCQYAWKKMDGFKMDGRSWKVDYATRDDFREFRWKWFEDAPSPARKRSPSRSHSDNSDTYKESPSRSRSRSPSR